MPSPSPQPPSMPSSSSPPDPTYRAPGVRTVTLLVVGVALLASTSLLRGQTASGTPVDPRLDSARAEFDVGRYFHAAEILRVVDRDAGLDPEWKFLHARAEAGYRNWRGVVEMLADADWAVGRADRWALLARAHEELGHREDAMEAYRRSLTEDATRSGGPSVTGLDPATDRRVRQARLARLYFEAGLRDSGLRLVSLLADSIPVLGAAAMVEGMSGAVEAGDTAFVRNGLRRIGFPGERDRLWEADAEATLAAGDTAGAEQRYRGLLVSQTDASRRAIALEKLGQFAMARGDTTAALEHFAGAFDLAPFSGAGMRSARPLADHTRPDAERSRQLGRSLDRLGDGRRALRMWDRHVELSQAAGVAPDDATRVERARLMVTVPSRLEEGIEEYRALDEHPDPAIGARVLELWAGLRRRQGETSNEATLRRWLIERYPDTDQAARVVFLRADAAHDRREWDRALELYGEVATMAPARADAGLARMRMGQIHLTRGDHAAAEAVFSEYLNDFPEGRRWEEAAYWAARTRVDVGRRNEVAPLLERLRRDEPFGYYTVMTGELMGERFVVPPLPPGELALSPAMRQWVDEVRTLDAAGYDDVADRHVDRAIEAAEAAGDPNVRLALAHSLNELGRTIDGINLGWALRREGVPWTQTLLRIVYPFPFREMIEREAEEWGLDPILVGALIRQESAFVEGIRSSAGAVGLMQVMPATGAEVARAVGPRDYTPQSLETAEVNLHLGARFLIQMLDRFGPELPLVLSAYNAGPTRANRWKEFPEVGEWDRFTERIPFDETRGYVKNITRNVAIYRAVYGERTVFEEP